MSVTRTARIFAVLLCAVVAFSATALTLAPANLGQIVQVADKGFEGEAVSVEVVKIDNEWADKITMKVIDPIIGGVQAGEVISWNQMRSGEKFALSGMPKYEVGKTYVVFLTAAAPGSQMQAPAALGQGSFRIHTNTETGEKLAVNEFQNRTLLQNVDVEKLSTAIATSSTKGSPNAAAAAAHALEVQGKLMNGPGGAVSLDALKAAAKTLKAAPVPSQAFLTTAPQSGMRIQKN